MKLHQMFHYVYCIFLMENIGIVYLDRILMIPFPMGSHVREHVAMAEALIEANHELYMIAHPKYPGLDQLRAGRINIIVHAARNADYLSFDMRDGEFFLEVTKFTPTEDMHSYQEYSLAQCTNILEDNEMYRSLRALHFDLAIVDSFPLFRCMLILPYRLGIPYISNTVLYEAWQTRNLAIPSFVPFNFGEKAYSAEMNFWERFDNARSLVQWTWLNSVQCIKDDLVTKYASEKPIKTLTELAYGASLWFIGTDWAIDYSRPLMANEVLTGGLNAKPSKSIQNSKLLEFVSEASDGIVVVSFGSLEMSPPKFILEKMADAFGKLPQRFIWKRPSATKDEKKLPDNVFVMPWIPQNDLLGQNSTKLFITHCGAGGQFEALYHAVPMINFPLFGDQHYNAKRTQARGYAITMSINAFTTQELVKNMNEVISNPKYKNNIVKGSRIFKSQAMRPSERVVYWTELILQHGADHLHSQALDLPWYQYLMLDLLAFLLLMLMLTFIATALITKVLWRIFLSKS